jgi:hypothetical protein
MWDKMPLKQGLNDIQNTPERAGDGARMPLSQALEQAQFVCVIRMGYDTKK